MKNNKYIVIVDPYQPTSTFQSLENSGFKLIAIYTCTNPGEYFIHRKVDDDRFSFVFYENKEGYFSILEKLKKINIARIIIGFDFGAKMALTLGHDLKLQNMTPLSSADFFSNKYLTGKYLKDYGLFPIAQFIVNHDNKDATVDLAIKKIGFPLILKPSNSAASFGVNICYSKNELINAIDKLLGTNDVLGNSLSELVIQEMLVGKEFALCTISSQKYHQIVAILSYDQELLYGQNMVRFIEIVEPSEKQYENMIKYVKNILDAVNFYSGPAATEVMLTKHGPCLIELNPRVAGINVEDLLKYCIGITQGELIVLSFTDEKLFIEESKHLIKKIAYGRIIFLRNAGSKKKLTQEPIDKIKKLKSCKQINLKYQLGDQLPITTDAFSMVANILLCNEDEEQFYQDYSKLMEIEKDFFS